MVVIVLEKCPQSLRGDLTKWMQEISVGVFVGRVGARVRDRLWERICEESKSGRATMVFPAQNEQHLDFRVHNTSWEPIDFDGMKLMMRPSSGRLKAVQEKRAHFSNAANHRKAAKHRDFGSKREPEEYTVVDVETTGLDCVQDSIIEIGAVRVVNGEIDDELQVFVNSGVQIPPDIEKLTGITQSMLNEGEEPIKAIEAFLDFIGSSPLVVHNADFDMGFIDAMLEKHDLDELDNQCIDTLKLARKNFPEMRSHSLESLASYFEVPLEKAHRALYDARTTRGIFLKLIE